MKRLALSLLLFSLPWSLNAEAPTSLLTNATAWIPISAAGNADPADLPEWISNVEFHSPDDSLLGDKARFRVRFPDAAPEGEELMVRLVFQDDSQTSPVLSAWDEIGNEIARTEPLGTGTGLPSSETVIVPVGGANYLEIEVPGEGRSLHGIFVNRVTKKIVREAVGFEKPPLWEDPFSGSVALPPSPLDTHLFGTVNATIMDETVRIEPANSVTIQFELERKPLAALLTFEVLNAASDAPPTVRVNNYPLGDSACRLPDFADPSYRGVVRPLMEGMRFHYAGWIPAQKMLPGKHLKTGTNFLMLTLPPGVDAAAVRSVQLQLKYFWEKIDYELRP